MLSCTIWGWQGSVLGHAQNTRVLNRGLHMSRGGGNHTEGEETENVYHDSASIAACMCIGQDPVHRPGTFTYA